MPSFSVSHVMSQLQGQRLWMTLLPFGALLVIGVAGVSISALQPKESAVVTPISVPLPAQVFAEELTGSFAKIELRRTVQGVIDALRQQYDEVELAIYTVADAAVWESVVEHYHQALTAAGYHRDDDALTPPPKTRQAVWRSDHLMEGRLFCLTLIPVNQPDGQGERRFLAVMSTK